MALRGLYFVGAVRSFVKSFEASTCYYDDEYRRHERPFTYMERFAIAAAGGIVFRFALPVVVFYDLNCIEMHLRGLDYARHETKIKGVMDVWF